MSNSSYSTDGNQNSNPGGWVYQLSNSIVKYTLNSSYRLKKPLWTAAIMADYLEQLDRTLQTATF